MLDVRFGWGFESGRWWSWVDLFELWRWFDFADVDVDATGWDNSFHDFTFDHELVARLFGTRARFHAPPNR